jgi:glucose-1-phosphate cytidylyltransferase
MKTVILCGGKGTRMKEFTNSIPKPMVCVGDKPILWHIMKIYSHFGFNEFVLCLGYKGEKIKEYFRESEWDIIFAETGENTNTGGRIKRIEKYIGEDNFFATYGDGLANIDLQKLLDFHLGHGKMATLTAVQPYSQFGILEMDKNGTILDFKEKPKLDNWINGGFFVFNSRIFEYLGENDILEKAPFERLAAEKQLMAYKHGSFWECMDTYKDNVELNEMWTGNNAKWAVWI